MYKFKILFHIAFAFKYGCVCVRLCTQLHIHNILFSFSFFETTEFYERSHHCLRLFNALAAMMWHSVCIVKSYFPRPAQPPLDYHYMTHFYFVALSKCATLMSKHSLHLHSFVCTYFVACNARKVFNHQRHYDYFFPINFSRLGFSRRFVAVTSMLL